MRRLVWAGMSRTASAHRGRWNMLIAASLFARGWFLPWASSQSCMLDWHALGAFVKLPDKQDRLTACHSHCLRLILCANRFWFSGPVFRLWCASYTSQWWKLVWCVACDVCLRLFWQALGVNTAKKQSNTSPEVEIHFDCNARLLIRRASNTGSLRIPCRRYP